MARIRITLVRSKIRCDKSQVRAVEALGLKKMHSSVEHEVNPQILGMVKKVSHLVKVEEI